MSKLGRNLMFVAGLCLLGLGITWLLTQSMFNFMWVALGASALLFVAALAVDWKFYFDFFTMKTTKQGMNMGVMILMVLVIMVGINYLGVHFDRQFDWTAEGLNSLTEQSVKVLEQAKQELHFVLLQKKEERESASIKINIQDMLRMYQAKSKLVTLDAYSARRANDLAKKFGFKDEPYGLYLESAGKQVKVDGLTEEAITRAIIKVTRVNQTKKIFYYLTGHQELNLEGEDPQTAGHLKNDLSTMYDLKPLNLLETQKVPDDAVAVAILGPKQSLLDAELGHLRDYARRGGKFVIAADPGEKHNLAQLMKSFGVEFSNQYIIDPAASVPGEGNVLSIGTVFSPISDVTRTIEKGGVAVFYLGSSLKRAPDAPKEFQVDEIVKSSNRAVALSELSNQAQPRPVDSVALAVSVSGKLANGATPAAEEFQAVIFADSDFLRNTLIDKNQNRDLALNAFSYLANDKDMIAIRPKQAKAAQFVLSDANLIKVRWSILLLMPIFMFLTGATLFFRRRNA